MLARWSVEEYAGHELGTGGGWTEFGSGFEAVPFVVDDGSGPVVVTVDGEEAHRRLEIDLDGYGDEPVVKRDAHERPPTHVREFLASRDVLDRQGETSVPTSDDGDEQGDRRYYGTVLGRGDEVYVAGIATGRADADAPAGESGARATISPPDDGASGTFYLSDRGRSAAVRGRLARAAVLGAAGLLLVWYELANFVPGVRFLKF